MSELYSVLLGEGSPIRLNTILPVGGNVIRFRISPDGHRVVYNADQETAAVFELYSVPLGGPAVDGVKLDGALVAGGNVDDFF